MRAWRTPARRSHEEHVPVADEPDVKGLDGPFGADGRHRCRGVGRETHYVGSVWTPCMLCDACMLRQHGALPTLTVFSDAYSREDDIAEEMDSLSAMRVAVRTL